MGGRRTGPLVLSSELSLFITTALLGKLGSELYLWSTVELALDVIITGEPACLLSSDRDEEGIYTLLYSIVWYHLSQVAEQALLSWERNWPCPLPAAALEIGGHEPCLGSKLKLKIAFAEERQRFAVELTLSAWKGKARRLKSSDTSQIPMQFFGLLQHLSHWRTTGAYEGFVLHIQIYRILVTQASQEKS